jgi:hypothetical protein
LPMLMPESHFFIVSCATAATLNATQAASVRTNSFFMRDLLFELSYWGTTH